MKKWFFGTVIGLSVFLGQGLFPDSTANDVLYPFLEEITASNTEYELRLKMVPGEITEWRIHFDDVNAVI